MKIERKTEAVETAEAGTLQAVTTVTTRRYLAEGDLPGDLRVSLGRIHNDEAIRVTSLSEVATVITDRDGERAHYYVKVFGPLLTKSGADHRSRRADTSWKRNGRVDTLDETPDEIRGFLLDEQPLRALDLATLLVSA